MSATPSTSPAVKSGTATGAEGTAVPVSQPHRASTKPRPMPSRSREAKQRAAAILEVLGGARTPADAARALGISLMRYYVLEERAVAGLVAACEPPPAGRVVDDARRCAALQRECQRWERECTRLQALVRAAQRTIGLMPPAAPAKDKGKKRRFRRPTVRALQAAASLRPPEEPAPEPTSTETAMKS